MIVSDMNVTCVTVGIEQSQSYMLSTIIIPCATSDSQIWRVAVIGLFMGFACAYSVNSNHMISHIFPLFHAIHRPTAYEGPIT